jgi:hypothetical protein
MPYGGLAIPMYNVISPTFVQLAGSATWSTDHTGFVDMITSEDSYILATFRAPKTILEDSAVRIEASLYKGANGTQAIAIEGGYFICEPGSAVDIAATSMTTLSALTATTATSTNTRKLGVYTLPIAAGSGISEDAIIVVKVGRTGNATTDAYGDDIVFVDVALRITTDDLGAPVS